MPLLLTAAGPLLPLLAWPLLDPLQRTMLLLITVVGASRFASRGGTSTASPRARATTAGSSRHSWPRPASSSPITCC